MGVCVWVCVWVCVCVCVWMCGCGCGCGVWGVGCEREGERGREVKVALARARNSALARATSGPPPRIPPPPHAHTHAHTRVNIHASTTPYVGHVHSGQALQGVQLQTMLLPVHPDAVEGHWSTGVWGVGWGSSRTAVGGAPIGRGCISQSWCKNGVGGKPPPLTPKKPSCPTVSPTPQMLGLINNVRPG